tara:strand:+ start:40 stop:534 length:495 start_codon:yes stop_codon:yes gene_type:complete
MKTFKQFNEESRMHLDEVDRNMMGLGTGLNLLAKGVGGLYKAGKFVGQKVVQPVMNAADKTYGKALYGMGAYQGTKSLLQGKPGEALRNFSAMSPGGRMYQKFKKFKNLGRLASTAQSINRYSTQASDKLDKIIGQTGRVIGGTADKLTNDKYDFDGKGKSKKK